MRLFVLSMAIIGQPYRLSIVASTAVMLLFGKSACLHILHCTCATTLLWPTVAWYAVTLSEGHRIHQFTSCPKATWPLYTVLLFGYKEMSIMFKYTQQCCTAIWLQVDVHNVQIHTTERDTHRLLKYKIIMTIQAGQQRNRGLQNLWEMQFLKRLRCSATNSTITTCLPASIRRNGSELTSMPHPRRGAQP